MSLKVFAIYGKLKVKWREVEAQSSHSVLLGFVIALFRYQKYRCVLRYFDREGDFPYFLRQDFHSLEKVKLLIEELYVMHIKGTYNK